MPLYQRASAECYDICNRMLEKYHGPLRDAGVTVDLLFATPKPAADGEIEPDAVALKHHGYQVAALCKQNAYKLRVQGHADAEIVVDGERWPAWSEEEREALIDHELEHLELKADRDGNVIRDDLDRPKLRIRLHDHEFGWFDSVARRHGKHSFEVQQYETFREAHRQLWLFDQVDDPSSLPMAATKPRSQNKPNSESGIESVTISSGGKSVTLKGDVEKAFKKAGILARGTGRRAAAKR